MSDQSSEKWLRHKISALHEFTQKVCHENDPVVQLDLTLSAAMEISGADGGTIYSMKENNTLNFEILKNDSLKIQMGGKKRLDVPFPPLPIYVEGEPNLHNVACAAVIKDKVINVEDAYNDPNYDFSGTRNFDFQTGYRSKSFLTIPLKDHRSDVIGVLQLINAKDENTGEVTTFSREVSEFVEYLAYQASITLSNQRLIHSQKKMFESFIELIAAAIDDKSPYTGGHCKRVPELTMMIADAAHESNDPQFKEFKMSKGDRYELHLASLLHDCGKITTPVHIVDKATKLETIVDRIRMVEERFEILKRDYEIKLLRDLVSSSLYEYELQGIDILLKQEVERLDEDKLFLKKANIGGEFMSYEDRKRVEQISQYKYKNPEGLEVNFLTLNEVKNLIIPKGTLLPEEREIINRHISVTIEMLEKIPYPKHLKRIPEFAGGHHERMDGKGYPKGLKRHEMSLQARIMGVADIFEALTAKDRPYKTGKTLTESLKILGKMKLDQHVDPDVFDLFVREKIYLKYAQKFLDPQQIDEVDEDQIPGYGDESAA